MSTQKCEHTTLVDEKMSERKQESDTSRVIKNPLFAVSSLGLIEDFKQRPLLLPAAEPIEDEPEPVKGKLPLNAPYGGSLFKSILIFFVKSCEFMFLVFASLYFNIF